MAAGNLDLLIKPASGLCNLRCRYCFYRDLQQHGAGGFGLMSRDIMETLVRRSLDLAYSCISYSFQGGEPTLSGLDFFRAFTEAVDACRQPGQTVSYAIQTNGMVLDEEWASFLKERGFLVGLSMDGPREYHDANRIDPEGEGTHKRVLQVWRMLRKAGVETNLLTVLNKTTARHPQQIYSYMKSIGADYLQFIACLDPLEAERGGEEYSLSPERYGSFLCGLFDCWLQDWRAGRYISIRQFDDWIHNLAGMPVSTCMSTGRCGEYLVIEADGSAYPCDFYVTSEHRLGTVLESTMSELSERAASFISESLQLPDACLSCPYAAACRGGCRRDRVFRGGVPFENYFCSAYRRLFAHAWEDMKEIAALERRAYRGRN